MAGVMRYHGSAAALQAARAYGEPLANFFPQASWVIATHFAHNKPRKNASGSIIPKARPIEKHPVAASCIIVTRSCERILLPSSSEN